MKRKDMKAEIASTSYPGRGILIGRSEDGKKAVIAYFIMGRSENSRNRVFEPVGDDLRTRAFDGKTWEDALRTRTFEPDGPNFTPRISGVVCNKTGAYRLSILKSDDNDESSAQRFFFEYPQPKAGEGHFIHTYMGDGNPLPSYEGEPTPVTVCGDLAQFTEDIWQSLDPDNKISLFTRFIDLETGKWETEIRNKNQ